MTAPRWFGHPGHFIAADNCRHHLHTHVGHYCVSTVGDYWPPVPRDATDPTPIGYLRLYETMVFPLTDDGEGVADWSGLDQIPANTADEADANHMAALEKWASAPKWVRPPDKEDSCA